MDALTRVTNRVLRPVSKAYRLLKGDVQYALTLIPRIKRRLWSRTLPKAVVTPQAPPLAPSFRTQSERISPVRVCFIRTKLGGYLASWEKRGLEIASKRANWCATDDPASKNLDEFDVFCVVKEPDESLIRELKRRGKTVVYDVLDCWEKPEDDLRYTNAQQCQKYFGAKWSSLGIDYFIFLNQTMKRDLGGLVKHSTTIYHHYRPDREPVPPRQRARVVAYDGDMDNLGGWLKIAERACAKWGLKFVVNPPDWSEVDIGLIARGWPYRSFLSNNYKATKLVNLYGTGTPALVDFEDVGSREIATSHVRFFKDKRELERELGSLLDYETRLIIHKHFLEVRPRFSLASIADEYERFFIWAHSQDNAGVRSQDLSIKGGGHLP